MATLVRVLVRQSTTSLKYLFSYLATMDTDDVGDRSSLWGFL